jgi:hypothetical protein
MFSPSPHFWQKINLITVSVHGTLLYFISLISQGDVLEWRETPFGDCGTGIEPQIQLLIAQDLIDQE